MSVHVLSWVLRNSEEKLGRRLTLLVLADHAHDDGTESWPSVETISREARLSRRQVQTCLRGLEESGAITRTGTHPSGTTIYSVDLELRGAKSAPPRAVSSMDGAQNRTNRGAETAPEPSLEPSKEQPSKNSVVALAFEEPPPVSIADGRNLPLDALCMVCGIDAKSPKMPHAVVALNGRGQTAGIRDLYWEECRRASESEVGEEDVLARLHEDPALFAALLAQRIEAKANSLRARDPWRTTISLKLLREEWLDVELSQRGRSDGGVTGDELRRSA